MDDDEELPGSGWGLSGRGGRIALVVLAIVVLVLGGIRLSSLGGSSPQPRPLAAVTPSPTGRPAAAPWPTVAGSCGPVQRPFVTSTPVRERTGARVLLGGDRLVSVDVDSGAVTTLGGPALAAGRSVIQLRGGSRVYAVTASCDAQGGRSLLRVQDDTVQAVPLPGLLGVLTVSSDASPDWALTSQLQPPHRSQLVSLTGHATVPLEFTFFPTALAGTAAVGDEIPGDGASWGEPPLVMARDAATGTLRGVLGEGWLMATAGDTVIWRDSCYDQTQTICHLRYAALSDPRRVRSIALPAGLFPTAQAATSPNGRLVAFPVLPTAVDAGSAASLEGADVAITDLVTGRVELVPGLRLPASPGPGLAFSADSRWVLIALNAGPQVRLLAWRPGLPLPQETAAVSVSASGQPALIAAAGH